MTHDDDPLARLLGEAFDARARDAVGDHTRPPAPRFAAAPAEPPARRARIWAPVAAAAAVVAIVAGVLGVSGALGGRDDTPVASRTGSSAVPSTPSASSAGKGVPADAGASAVHIRTATTDGATYGVGMPVIAYFSRQITDGRSLQAVTRATVDGRPVEGAWYFAKSAALTGYPIEGHFRPRAYWPAHSQVRVDIPAKGLSAGKGLGFDNDLTLEFGIGQRTVITVDDTEHRLRVNTDGRDAGSFPVSLGAAGTPTTRGIKVIMKKGVSLAMSGPGYYDPSVKFTQQLTYSGEYLHAAPWNSSNIARGRDTSNGCTNLDTADASKLYDQTQVGDVVTYPNASGAPMTIGQGYGDWNVPWTTWLTGGLVRTR